VTVITFDAFKLKVDSGVYKNGTAARRALGKLRGLTKGEEEKAGELLLKVFGPPGVSHARKATPRGEQVEVHRLPSLQVRYFSLDYKSRMATLEFLRTARGMGVNTCGVLLSILEESETSLRKK